MYFGYCKIHIMLTINVFFLWRTPPWEKRMKIQWKSSHISIVCSKGVLVTCTWYLLPFCNRRVTFLNCHLDCFLHNFLKKVVTVIRISKREFCKKGNYFADSKSYFCLYTNITSLHSLDLYPASWQADVHLLEFSLLKSVLHNCQRSW